MKRMPPHAVPLALAAMLTVSGAQAQAPPEDLSQATLEELMNVPITTASRMSERLTDAPARMQVVTADQIRRRGYRSLIELLEDLSDFKVDRAGDQDYPVQLTVQGSRGADLVLVLLDGIRVSSPTNEPLSIAANYPIHSARQVEILYGPASAVYGADAFSAIVNIITRDADDPGLALEASAGQDSLYNQSASYAARLGASGSLLLAGQFLYDGQPDLSTVYPADFRGLEGQRTGIFNTIFGPMPVVGVVSPAYDIPISAHSLQAAMKLGGLHLSLFQSQLRAPTTPAYTPDNGVYNDAAFNRNVLLTASGSYTRPIGALASTSTLTYSRHELDPESGYWNVYSNMKKSYKYAFGSMLKAEEQLAWRPGSGTTVTAGGTVERFFAIPQSADLNAPIESRDRPGTILDTTLTDDFVKLRYWNSGAYTQLQHRITARLTATLGARGDYNTRYGGTFNPRLGLVARAAADTTVKVLYGTAYLAPSPYQTYAHYGSFYSTDGGTTYASEYWHLGNPDLTPQKKQSLEVNLLQGLGSYFGLSASAFYAHVNDRIQDTDPDRAYAGLYKGWPVAYIDFPVNEGDDTIYGATVRLDFLKAYGAGRIEARAAVTLADGQAWEPGEEGTDRHLPVGGMSPVRWNLGADLQHGRWVVAPRLLATGRQRLRVLEETGGEDRRKTLDGYSIVDVTIRRIDLFGGLDLFALVENLLDTRYRHINLRAYSNPEELIGAPQNPRRLTIGVQYQLP